jgi:manganese transport protein
MKDSDKGEKVASWKYFLGSVAPGIFMVGYVIGTGSVTTMATAGANYGLSLLWTLLLASIFTYVMFYAISKLTVTNDETLLHSFRTHFGSGVSLFIIFGLMLTQIASVIGVMGILTDVVQEWSRPFTAQNQGVSRLVSALFFTFLLLALFWKGKHQFFLTVVSFFVAMMGISFLITVALVAPHWRDFIAGLVPRIPSTGNPHLLIAGMVGTTMASVVLFSRSIVVKEKGWRASDLGEIQRDTLLSVSLLFIVNAAIVASAAGTMFVVGARVENATDMIRMLEPLAGRLASTAFVVGIVAAGLSSLFPNYLLGPWMISDFSGSRRDLSRTGYRLLVIVTASFGLIVPIFGGRPVQIMIASQAVSPIIMPLIVLLVATILLKPAVVGAHKNSLGLNIALAVTALFSLYMSVLALIGFFSVFRR